MEIVPIGPGAEHSGEARRKERRSDEGTTLARPADSIALSDEAKALLAARAGGETELRGPLPTRPERIHAARLRIARGYYQAAPVKGVVLAKLVEALLGGAS